MPQPPSSPSSLERSVTRLGRIGLIWGVVLLVVCAGGVAWVLLATSTDPAVELFRNGQGVLLAALPGLAGAAASVIGMQFGRRRARRGQSHARLPGMLALGLLGFITFGIASLALVTVIVTNLTLSL